jgi:hypothetical protein
MRTLLFALLASPLIALAQPTDQTFESNKPVICGFKSSVIEGLTKNWHEEPIWVARMPPTSIMLLVNAVTKTWTLIEYTDEYACILGNGKDYMHKEPETKGTQS